MIITNKKGLPTPYLKACESHYKYKPKRYSVTSVLCSPRETILKRRHQDEIIQDCSSMHWLIFGTAVHKVLEDYDGGINILKESSLEYHTANGYTLSGRLDLYDIDKGIVYDWKTASTWKWVANDFEDYEKQLRLYALMLRCKGLPVNKSQLVFMFKDWSENKLSQDLDGSYPDTPTISKEFKITDDDLINEVNWVESYFADIEKLEQVRDEELPICSAKERTFNGKDTYAIMKKGRKRALKLCDTAQEAEKELANKGGDFIELRLASDKKCENYCQASPFCSYYQQHYAKYLVKDNNDIIRAGFGKYEEAKEYVKLINKFGELHIEKALGSEEDAE